MDELASDNMAGVIVSDLIAQRPDCMRVFARHGMACIGCPMARFETVAEVVEAYHLDVGAFVRELRRTLDDQSSSN